MWHLKVGHDRFLPSTSQSIIRYVSCHLSFNLNNWKYGSIEQRYDMIYLLTAIGLSPSGRSTVHIYTQTIHRTIHKPTRLRRLSSHFVNYSGLFYNRQVVGSIPDDVIGIFQWHNASGRAMALGLTWPLKEMSTRCISWGWRQPMRKADNLTTILCCCHEIWEP